MTSQSKRGKSPKKGGNPNVEDVADHLHSSAIGLLRALRRQDDKWGLSAPRLSALSVVVFAGPIKLGDLARAEQVKPPTMTKLVRALESARLVTRKVDAVDGRVTWITATEKGKDLLKKGRARRVEALAARLRSLPRDDVDSLDEAAGLIRELVKGL